MNRFIEHHIEQINNNLDNINDLFIEECQTAIDKMDDGEYEIIAGMGVLSIERDGVFFFRRSEMPDEIAELDKFWNKMIDDYSYYMDMDKIDNYTMKG